MPLTLWDVKRDPIASRALEQLRDRYTVAEEKTGLVLTGMAGDMKLFLNELDDLHQWDFIHNQKTATENEKPRSFSQNLYEQREIWKYRALVAEEKTGLVLTGMAGDMKLFLNELADLHQWDFIHNQKTATENEKLRSFSQNLYEQREIWKYRALVAEATLLEVADASNNGGRQNVSDMRYAALKRYLAKQFHPDHAPGNGLEKIVRNEIFKEIWGEVERLDNQTVSADRSATARSSAAV